MPSKEQWTDRSKNRMKRKISVYLNGINDPIALEPGLNHQRNLKYLNQAKYSKIVKEKNTGETR